MKKLLSCTFISLYALCTTLSYANAGNLNDLDKKFGFREFKCNSDVSKYKNIHLFKNDGLLKIYKKYLKEENYKLGNYTLSDVYYVFYKNKLYRIGLNINGKNNRNGVFNILKEAYGQPKQDNEFLEDYDWYADKIFLNYKEKNFSEKATVTFDCVSTLGIYNEEKRKLDKKAKSEL